MSHDLILKGGRVIDPSQNHDGVIDVGFTNGKVSGRAARSGSAANRQTSQAPATEVIPDRARRPGTVVSK
jgi:predicted amidohydrolase